MLNTNRSTIVMGTFLIGLGLVWWLDLWWLLLPVAMIVAGGVGYLQRRSAGRANEALHIAIWGVGMGLMLLLNFLWPGVLFVAGASILLRGREAEVEATVRRAITRVRGGRANRSSAERVPVETGTTTIVPITSEQGAYSDQTRRL
jgi:hypothetical protein